jgi:DNA replication protein DnaC
MTARDLPPSPPAGDGSAGEPCPHCFGTGYQVQAGEDGVERARPCRCRDRQRETALVRAARIPRRYEHCSFENYESHHEAQEAARQFARRFVKEFPLGEMGLLFTGPCGTGKTHLAVAILKALLRDRGLHCLFYDFQDLLKEIQASYSPVSHSSEMDILQPVFTCDVLVLDDLGAQKPTAWVRDTVGHIINNRYNSRRVILFTTNRKDIPEDEPRAARPGDRSNATLLDQIGHRIHSRVYEMCRVVPIEGPDYRKLTRQPGLRSLLAGPGTRRPPRSR